MIQTLSPGETTGSNHSFSEFILTRWRQKCWPGRLVEGNRANVELLDLVYSADGQRAVVGQSQAGKAETTEIHSECKITQSGEKEWVKARGQAWTGKVGPPTCQGSPRSWGDTCSWPPSSWRWRRPACDWRSRWPWDGQSRQRRLTSTEIWRSSAPWAGFPGSPSYARSGHLGRKRWETTSFQCLRAALLTMNEHKSDQRPMWESLEILNRTFCQKQTLYIDTSPSESQT